MAFEFETVVIAEGVTQDSRGAPTLVGVGRNVALTAEFPFNRHFAIYARARAVEDLEVGEKLQWRVEVVDSQGTSLGVLTQIGTMEEKKYPQLPGGVQVLAELDISLPGPGTFIARVTVDAGGQTQIAEAPIYVVEQPVE